MSAQAHAAAGRAESLIRNSNAAARVAVGVVLLRVRVPGVRGGLAALRGARGEEHPDQARRQAQGQRGKDQASGDVLNNHNFDFLTRIVHCLHMNLRDCRRLFLTFFHT